MWLITDPWKDLTREGLPAWQAVLSKDAFERVESAFRQADGLGIRIYREHDATDRPTYYTGRGSYEYFAEFDNCWMRIEPERDGLEFRQNIYVHMKG
jgi:hypothetical protein